MKANYLLTALLSTLVCLVQSSAIPVPDLTVMVVDYDRSLDTNGTMNFVPADDDDEWTMVVYDKSVQNGGCEGKSEKIKGRSLAEACYKFFTSHVECVEFEVRNGLPNCKIVIKPNCGSGPIQSGTVEGGHSVTYKVHDAGAASVSCNK